MPLMLAAFICYEEFIINVSLRSTATLDLRSHREAMRTLSDRPGARNSNTQTHAKEILENFGKGFETAFGAV